MSVRTIWVALLGALLLAACAMAPPPQPGGDWTAHNGDAAETAFSPLEQIDIGNVGRLGLAFALDLPGETTLEATPVAVGGVLYFTGAHAAVYAVDGKTGKLLWKYDPETWKVNPWMLTQNFAANRGVARVELTHTVIDEARGEWVGRTIAMHAWIGFSP